MENFAAITCQKLFSFDLTESSAEYFFSKLLDTPFFQKVLMENFATISCQKGSRSLLANVTDCKPDLELLKNVFIELVDRGMCMIRLLRP